MGRRCRPVRGVARDLGTSNTGSPRQLAIGYNRRSHCTIYRDSFNIPHPRINPG